MDLRMHFTQSYSGLPVPILIEDPTLNALVGVR